jgi:hypothetical protein
MLAKHSISKSWGPNPKYAKWAYTGIIRPALSSRPVSHRIESSFSDQPPTPVSLGLADRLFKLAPPIL